MNLEARVAHLERTNKRLCACLLGMVVAAACTMMMGAAYYNQGTLEHLKIVDKNGNVRIRLGVTQGNDARIELNDRNGRNRLVLRTEQEYGGIPQVIFYNSQGTTVIGMGTRNNPRPGVKVYSNGQLKGVAP